MLQQLKTQKQTLLAQFRSATTKDEGEKLHTQLLALSAQIEQAEKQEKLNKWNSDQNRKRKQAIEVYEVYLLDKPTEKHIKVDCSLSKKGEKECPNVAKITNYVRISDKGQVKISGYYCNSYEGQPFESVKAYLEANYIAEKEISVEEYENMLIALKVAENTLKQAQEAYRAKCEELNAYNLANLGLFSSSQTHSTIYW